MSDPGCDTYKYICNVCVHYCLVYIGNNCSGLLPNTDFMSAGLWACKGQIPEIYCMCIGDRVFAFHLILVQNYTSYWQVIVCKQTAKGDYLWLCFCLVGFNVWPLIGTVLKFAVWKPRYIHRYTHWINRPVQLQSDQHITWRKRERWSFGKMPSWTWQVIVLLVVCLRWRHPVYCRWWATEGGPDVPFQFHWAAGQSGWVTGFGCGQWTSSFSPIR